MLKTLIELFSNVASSFAELPSGKKIALLAAGALVIGGMTALSLQTQKPDYEVLFSNLSSDDLGEIVMKLKAQKVQHKIAAGGSAVLVPSKDVFDLRIQLASDGLPRGGGIGFEVFDKSNLGMTEFIQKLNLMRAITGELTRTINSLDNIESSRVHIAAPEKSVFLEEEKRTTASVVLKLRGTVSQGQVQGIVHLVASSIEGLAPDDVTIVDIKGNILAGAKDDDSLAQMSSNQLDYKRNIEKTLENRIKSLLGAVIGHENISAKVSTEIDFKQSEQTEELFDPESQVVRSEQRNEESNIGSSPPGGVVGVTANQPGGQVTQITPPSPPKSQKSNETINYEINKVTKRVVNPVGLIKKQSIAVMVDGSYDPEGKYVARSAEEVQQYKKIVERAVGYDEERGDKIEVINVAFDTSKFDEDRLALEKAESRELMLSIARYVVTAIFIILLFVMLIKPLIAWLGTTSMSAAELAGGGGEGGFVGGEGGEGSEEDELSIPKKDDYRQMVVDFAKEEPTHTTELVRKWIKERR